MRDCGMQSVRTSTLTSVGAMRCTLPSLLSKNHRNRGMPSSFWICLIKSTATSAAFRDARGSVCSSRAARFDTTASLMRSATVVGVLSATSLLIEAVYACKQSAGGDCSAAWPHVGAQAATDGLTTSASALRACGMPNRFSTRLMGRAKNNLRSRRCCLAGASTCRGRPRGARLT